MRFYNRYHAAVIQKKISHNFSGKVQDNNYLKKILSQSPISKNDSNHVFLLKYCKFVDLVPIRTCATSSSTVFAYNLTLTPTQSYIHCQH